MVWHLLHLKILQVVSLSQDFVLLPVVRKEINMSYVLLAIKYQVYGQQLIELFSDLK
jgi:hypothetical protein